MTKERQTVKQNPSRNRSGRTDSFFPPDLAGASVLEIGGGENLFCIEARRRNAGRVVGIDVDEERLAAATQLAAAENLQIELLQASLGEAHKLGVFDYVVCRELPRHVRDPIGAIHQLLDLTKRKLILEVEDVDLKIVRFAKKRRRQALLGAWRTIFKLLPRALRPGILVVDSHGKFLMSPKWIKNLLRAQRQDVDRVEFVDSDEPYRYFALVHLRRLSELLLVAGPSGAGKSHFVERLVSMDAELKHLLRFDGKENWQVMGDVALDEGVEVKANKLVLEYNIWRPVERDWDDYKADPALTIMRVADARRVCLLACPREVAVERLRARRETTAQAGVKVEWLAEEYSRPGRYRKMYERWISYCKANGCDIAYVDIGSREIKAVSEEEALKVIGRNS
jgi:hypothetical protein